MVEAAKIFAELRNVVIFGYCWLSLVLVLRSGDFSPRFRRIAAVGFAIVSIGSLILMRGERFFLNLPLNMDEAQFLASAMKFRTNLNTWASVDTTSSGPLDMFVLMWPFVFGLEVSFFSARVTAAALIALSWILFWDALRDTTLPIRVTIGAALVLFFGTAVDPDFVHYSSELLPVCLIMVGLRVTLHATERRVRLGAACLAAVCLGMVPFAKLQATVIAAPLGLMMVWLVSRSSARPLLAAGAMAIGAALPAIMILVPLGTAEMFDFWVSYFGFAGTYVGGGWAYTAGSGFVPGLVALISVRSGAVFLASVAMLPIAAWVLAVGGRRSGSCIAKVNDEAGTRRIVLAIVAASSIAAVMLPRRPFPHYAVLAVWPWAALAGTEASRAYRKLSPSRRVAVSALAALPVLLLACDGWLQYRPSYIFAIVAPEKAFGSGDLLASPTGAKGRMLVWGWMPQFYVWSGWRPATRDAHTYNQINPSPYRDFYRDRMMSELRADPPEYILDAVAPDSFGFTDPSESGIASFPELRDFVDQRYLQINIDPQSRCPRLYARKDLARWLADRYIKAVSISSAPPARSSSAATSPDHVADGSVFETCGDAWLLGPGQAGEVVLTLDGPQPVGAIEILNTRGSNRPRRASGSIELVAYRGEETVYRGVFDVGRFPYARVIDIPANVPAMDRLSVRILSSIGEGSGLNEIRVRRRPAGSDQLAGSRVLPEHP